jgi:hypothetical protein
LNVAHDLADSWAQELPLLGGENAAHDWWLLPTEWDLLPRDTVTARDVEMSAATAFVIVIVSGVAGAADLPPPGATTSE